MPEHVETRNGATLIFWTRYSRAEIRAGWEFAGYNHDQAVARGDGCIVWPIDQSGAEELTALLLRNCAAMREAYHFDGSTLSFYTTPYRGGSDAIVHEAQAIYERWAAVGAAEAAKLDGRGPLFAADAPPAPTPSDERVPFSGTRDRSAPPVNYDAFPYGLYGGYD